jgi:hypothetical protein
MNNTPDIIIEVTTNVTLPDLLKQMRQQWSYKEIVEGIIDFVEVQPDEKFEDALIAALNKFKADNAPVDVAESINRQIRRP